MHGKNFASRLTKLHIQVLQSDCFRFSVDSVFCDSLAGGYHDLRQYTCYSGDTVTSLKLMCTHTGHIKGVKLGSVLHNSFILNICFERSSVLQFLAHHSELYTSFMIPVSLGALTVVSYPPPSGDNPPHDIWNETFASQLEVTQFIVDYLAQQLPNINIYPAIGNHGMQGPINYDELVTLPSILYPLPYCKQE